MEVFDTYKCILGEGAFWHPKLNQFFWFDIEGKKLFTKSNHKTKIWSFKEMPSACSWIDNEHLLIAFESSLSTFNILSTFLYSLSPTNTTIVEVSMKELFKINF